MLYFVIMLMNFKNQSFVLLSLNTYASHVVKCQAINICVVLCCKHFEFSLLFVIISFMFKFIKLKICGWNFVIHIMCIFTCVVLGMLIFNFVCKKCLTWLGFVNSQQIHKTQILCITWIACHFVLNLWDIS
jgi:hypothetical protein